MFPCVARLEDRRCVVVGSDGMAIPWVSPRPQTRSSLLEMELGKVSPRIANGFLRGWKKAA